MIVPDNLYEEPNFRRHLHALLHDGTQIPSAVIEQQKRLEQRILNTGMSERLPYLMAGVHDIEKKSCEPFEIFVLGEGKHGKSTFINAILGANVAPTDFLPKTWCFNRYISRTMPTNTVKLFVDPQLLRNSTSSHLEHLLSQKAYKIYRNLYEIVVSDSEAQSIMQIEESKTTESLGTTNPYFSPVMEIEWSVSDTNVLLPGIRLVDTMGINQRLASSSHKTHLTWQYERADAVIWIISSDKIGSKDLRQELQNARRYSKYLLLVVNKWDKLSADGQKRAYSKLEKEYAGLVSAMIPVSSLAAVAARQGLGNNLSGDEKQWLSDNEGLSSTELLVKSGFVYLHEHLKRFQDGRQIVSRNLQIYSALRQKGFEFRKMAGAALLDARANIELFELIIEKITETMDLLQERAANTMTNLQATTMACVNDGMKQIIYENREHIHGLLRVDSITNDMHLAFQNETIAATNSFAAILTWLITEKKRYQESEFSATGDIADKIYNVCISKTKVTVALPVLCYSLPNVKDCLRDAWIWFLDLFGCADKKKREVVNNIKMDLNTKFIPQLKTYFDESKSVLIDAIAKEANDLKSDCTNQYEKNGGKAKYLKDIENITQVLIEPTVEPLLIKLPLRMMKRLKWRKQ